MNGNKGWGSGGIVVNVCTASAWSSFPLSKAAAVATVCLVIFTYLWHNKSVFFVVFRTRNQKCWILLSVPCLSSVSFKKGRTISQLTCIPHSRLPYEGLHHSTLRWMFMVTTQCDIKCFNGVNNKTPLWQINIFIRFLYHNNKKVPPPHHLKLIKERLNSHQM